MIKVRFNPTTKEIIEWGQTPKQVEGNVISEISDVFGGYVTNSNCVYVDDEGNLVTDEVKLEEEKLKGVEEE